MISEIKALRAVELRRAFLQCVDNKHLSSDNALAVANEHNQMRMYSSRADKAFFAHISNCWMAAEADLAVLDH